MLLLLQWFEKDTVGEYRRRYGDDELVRVVEIAHPSTGEIFVKRLYKELDAVIDEIERTASLRQKDGEDHITSDIVLGLRRAGYNATHDAYSKGHADIKVAQDEFVWLGEAKIHDGYDYLLKGLKQLLSRYATGREKGSGLLVYIKGGNASAVLAARLGRTPRSARPAPAAARRTPGRTRSPSSRCRPCRRPP
jgi:hypothetical protein